MFKFIRVNHKIHPKVEKIFTNWFCLIENTEQLENFIKIRSNDLMRAYHELKMRKSGKLGHYNGSDQISIGTFFETIDSISSKKRKTAVDDAVLIADTFLLPIEEVFHKKGHLLVNINKGFRFLDDTFEIIETQMSEDFIFPNQDLTEKDIRIIQWPNGTHYYAKVRDVDVVDEYGDQKWFSKKEANDAAISFIKRLKGQ